MLEQTFIHLPRITAYREQLLWSQGIRTWDDFERDVLRQPSLFADHRIDPLEVALNESREALERGDFNYFAERLLPRERFRIALTVPEKTAFVDIETTGLSHYYDTITLIGASMGSRYVCHIKGQKPNELIEFLRDAKCLVTFNGTIFDLKFLRKELPQPQLPKGHVDLRFFGRPVGLKGPQKKIEIDIGFKRESDLEGVTGERAPLLWHEYLLGDLESAKTLIEYNFADIEGMRRILDVALERLSKTERIPDDVIDSAGFSKKQPRLRFASSERTHSKNRIFIPRYSGRKGPAITLRRLRLNNRGKNLSIVGIDLTGSEARPTGWCHLQGGKAVTKVISKTRDLIEETMATNPDIVSIDSPLSLPKGRRSAFDDDPGRNEFGIMRGCERTLKRRGVNVYPALIPSMQRLTQRGMRLAQSFRKLGVPVIESYPGAAQDIMGIPRKSSGLDYLKKGLKDFGVRGEFLKQKVTHDEVDAVTSAVVGLFFWAGKFEALGNEEEEYLIIPDLAAKPETWLNRVVVGISGPIAAGKTTAGKHMSDKGFVYGRYSQVLEYTLRERGQPVNRTTLQKLGERFHRNPGQRWLSRRLIGQLPVDKDLVIDGLRWPEDHAFMVETFGPAFFHLHLNASDSVRENRYLQRGGTKDDFEAASVHRVEAKVPHLAMRADHTIENEMTLKGFTRTISRAISTVIKEIGE